MMQIIRTIEELRNLKDNQLKGEMLELVDSLIKFNGEGNILYCEGVKLVGSTIEFNDSKSIFLETECGLDSMCSY